MAESGYSFRNVNNCLAIQEFHYYMMYKFITTITETWHLGPTLATPVHISFYVFSLYFIIFNFNIIVHVTLVSTTLESSGWHSYLVAASFNLAHFHL